MVYVLVLRLLIMIWMKMCWMDNEIYVVMMVLKKVMKKMVMNVVMSMKWLMIMMRNWM